jgi:hypothetical protein
MGQLLCGLLTLGMGQLLCGLRTWLGLAKACANCSKETESAKKDKHFIAVKVQATPYMRVWAVLLLLATEQQQKVPQLVHGLTPHPPPLLTRLCALCASPYVAAALVTACTTGRDS